MATAMILALWVFVLLIPPLFAKHPPLLPRPQHITYSEGKLPLRGVSISLGSTPLPEDRFARANWRLLYPSSREPQYRL